MYPASSSAYDRAITVFSPDGRLFQVEYAREAVKRGTTALGIVYADGVLLATDKSLRTKLVKTDSIEKIFKIDDHIGAATSGLVADARRLIHHARVEAQREKVAYNEPMGVEAITKEVCDLKQMYTQYGGTRPFGTSLLIMGVDEQGPRLFETDPSGAFSEVFAAAIGVGKKDVEAVFEKKYDQKMSRDAAVALALEVLKSSSETKTTMETLAVAYIDVKTRKIANMSQEDIKKALQKAKA